MSWKTRLREVKKIIYNLKRAYGLSITLSQGDAPVNNYETGVTTQSWTDTVIKRAIILPYKEARELTQGLTYLKAGINFVYGGYYDIRKRLIVIDKDDLSVNISLNDYITFNSKKWEIKSINMAEHNQAYMLEVVELEATE